MTSGLWVKGPFVVLWAVVGFLTTSSHAHSAHHNPYLDPDYYNEDSRINLRHRIPVNVVEESEISDELALQVRGGREEAIQLAARYGLEYLDQVFEDPAVYHLQKSRSNIRTSKRPRREAEDEDLLKAISREPGVEWVDQQLAFVRQKRTIPFRPNYSRRDRKDHSHRLENTNHYHSIPADVDETVRALRRVIHKSRETSRTNVSKSRSLRDYLEEDLGIGGSSLNKADIKLDPNAFTYVDPPKHRQNQGISDHSSDNSSESSPKDLVQIPLSRTEGFSLKYDRTGVRNPVRDNLGNSNRTSEIGSKGRIYIPRFLQLKNEINLVSKNERNEREDETSTETKQEDDGKENENFGDWIDQVVESSKRFNDPCYKDQWYLQNTGQLGRVSHDINVTWAWDRGYTGRGIIMSVLDDGLQITNAEIAANYDPSISYSLIRDGGPKDDPSPRLDPSFSNSHGTYCAAIMAAVPNNSVCGVGVAFDAKVGGVRLVDGKVTDIQEATALSRAVDRIDVFSASWGPTDDGTRVEGPGRLTRHAFVEGVTKGRGGKGALYVWASGNGGLVGDNCNLDGYTSSIYTLSVSALTDIGTSTFYEEPCASTLAAVYVGGEHTLRAARERQKRNMRKLRVVVPELDGHCSEDFQGTSAAAPLMAGIVGLVLQANTNLTWRDVQHLVVETSSPTPSALEEPGWQTNGRGKKFHLMQGYGAVDAGKMVESALKWVNVKPQKTVIVPMFNGHRDVSPLTWMNVSHAVDFTDLPSADDVMTGVEHVVADITINHPLRKLLTIFIVSPSGTASQVLTHRGPDTSQAGFNSWGFMSVHFWGEDPQGTWKVAIKDDSGKKGFLKKVLLTIYGS